MADSKTGRIFPTPLGIVVADLQITLQSLDGGQERTLIQDDIADLKIGYSVFTYEHGGFIEYRDRGGLLTDGKVISPSVNCKIKFKLDMLNIGETYYSTGMSKKDGSNSSDTTIRIDFVNKTAKMIRDVASVRTFSDPNQPISSFLKDLLEKYGIQTGIWKNGTTSFPDKHFWNDTLANIIEDIKIMDCRRDSGNLFTLFADFNGKVHYMEIADLMKTVSGSASKNKLWYASFGHDFGLGFFTAPTMIASHQQFSVNVDEIYQKAQGYKVLCYNRDTKLVTPFPAKEGRDPIELYNSLPGGGGDKTISEKLMSKYNMKEYLAPYCTMSDEDVIRKVSEAVASRPMAFLDFFRNNSIGVRMGFFNPRLQIVSEDGTINNGVSINKVQEEPAQIAIGGDWMIMGFTHYLHSTQFYTDVDLVRTVK